MRIAQGAWLDEVPHRLGISISGEAPPPADVQQEVLMALWEPEKVKLVRELMVIEKQETALSRTRRTHTHTLRIMEPNDDSAMRGCRRRWGHLAKVELAGWMLL